MLKSIYVENTAYVKTNIFPGFINLQYVENTPYLKTNILPGFINLQYNEKYIC